MSNKNLKKSENVDAILSRLKGIYEVKTDIELAKKLGYTSTGALSNWRARGAVNWNRINKYCENVNKEFLTTGEGQPLKELKNENTVPYESIKKTYGDRKAKQSPSRKERD